MRRLLCGDTADPAVVDRLVEGIAPQLVVTDAPYGVSYDPVWHNEAGG